MSDNNNRDILNDIRSSSKWTKYYLSTAFAAVIVAGLTYDYKTSKKQIMKNQAVIDLVDMKSRGVDLTQDSVQYGGETLSLEEYMRELQSADTPEP